MPFTVFSGQLRDILILEEDKLYLIYDPQFPSQRS